MKITGLLLSGVAALALTACGGGDDSAGKTSAPVNKVNVKAAKADSASPIDQKFTLKDATALDVDAFFALLPADKRPTYEAATFDEKLGATIITDLKFSGDEFEVITVDRTELYGLDMDAIEKVNAAEEASADTPFETIFEKVRMFGITPVDRTEDAEITIGAMELDKFRVRPGAFSQADDTPAMFFNGVELGGFYLKDLKLVAASEEAGQFDIQVPDLRLVGVGGGKLNALVVNDLNYKVNQSQEAIAALGDAMGPAGQAFLSSPLGAILTPGEQEVSLETLTWHGFDMSKVLEYGLRDETPPLTERGLANYGAGEMVGFVSKINGKTAMTSEKLSYSIGETTWLIPMNVTMKSTKDVYDFSAYVPEDQEDLQKIVADYGLNNVTGSSDINWNWDPKGGDAALTTAFNSKGFVEYDLSFDLEGMEIDEINALVEAGDEDGVAKLAKFKNFNLKLDDEKLLDVAFAVAALQMNSSAKDLREAAPGMLRLTGMQAAQMNPRISDYVDAVANFISDGGALSINAEPEDAVTFETLAATGQTAPQTLPDVLNLTVTHSK